MKLDIVTFSVNERDDYVRFWGPQSKYTKEKLGLHPVLLYCGKDDIDLDEEYGDVHRIYCGDDIPTYLPSTWGYFWVSSLYPDRTCITSGIDMFIVDVDYFNSKIESFDEESYVVMNATGYNPLDKFYAWESTVPSYYHVAKGSTFKSLLDFDDSFVDEIVKYDSLDYSKSINGYSDHVFVDEASVYNGGKWCTDELYSSDMLLSHIKNKNENIKLLSMDDTQWRINNPNSPFYHFHKPYPTAEQIFEMVGV